jgi:hypothetical protein
MEADTVSETLNINCTLTKSIVREDFKNTVAAKLKIYAGINIFRWDHSLDKIFISPQMIR